MTPKQTQALLKELRDYARLLRGEEFKVIATSLNTHIDRLARRLEAEAEMKPKA